MALQALEPFATDLDFQARYAAARQTNKQALAKIIADRLLIKVDPTALFDVQIKRIHEYKRQLLNILETIALYNEIRAQPMRDFVPRVKIFAGKAAASYHSAKLIIKLANDVARVVNNDPTVRDLLKVVFLPNYNVSLAESIIPAADLSEQISTAGMEASGTGNMKMALNGALTIGTLDGANVEIKEKVGDDNIFIFGLTAEEVAARRSRGIDARETIAASPVLREVLQSIADGAFSPDDRDRYASLVDILTYHDHFLVTADFDAYVAAQAAVVAALARPQVVVALGHPQHGAHRLVFVGPHHRRICRRHLEGSGSPVMSPNQNEVPVRDAAALVAGLHPDPFGILGPHEQEGGAIIRVFVPGARKVSARLASGETVALKERSAPGFFEGFAPFRPPFAYRLHAENDGGAWDWDDPYRFGPILGPMDDHLLVEGAHLQLYARLGAHKMTHEGVDGVHFSVWAPNARRVSVVGAFNQWDGRRHPLRKRIDSGLWEIFIPEIAEGELYKFEILGDSGQVLPLKADPFGLEAQLRPSTASVVACDSGFNWTDADYLSRRATRDPRRSPMSIYEVHLGSWRRGEDNRFLTYDELADSLIPYARDQRLHPSRIAADFRTSARRLLGLPADRPVRADLAFRRRRGLQALRRSRPC